MLSMRELASVSGQVLFLLRRTGNILRQFRGTITKHTHVVGLSHYPLEQMPRIYIRGPGGGSLSTWVPGMSVAQASYSWESWRF
eukprot:scaffold254680_cov15-Tisochrysis_lutea.AAC.1